ncbi:MAG: histidine ammonia-lyase [Fimbriimonadia bacterium]
MSHASAEPLELNGAGLTLGALAEVVEGRHVRLSAVTLERLAAARAAVIQAAGGSEAVYGVNTGFGPLRDRRVDAARLAELQLNLVRSHAAGVGPLFSSGQVRGAMALLINCLAHGNSGINPSIVQLIVDFLNNSIHPIVPSQGSLGASGDLAPLAHVALCLVGEGDVEFGGARMPVHEALSKTGLSPVTLGPKDGLSLVNGTHFLTAVGALAAVEAADVIKSADIAAALHVEASLSSIRPYSEEVLMLRPHPGALQTAANVRRLVEGSGLMRSHENCGEVQDAYSVRCVPQVHGAVRQAWMHAVQVLEVEMNAVTDNPVWVGGQFVSAGNFHGEPCALALDYLTLGLVELGNISERRTERLLNPALSRGLSAFLASDPGVESGLMLAHYTAAALASENKSLAFPPSADTIPTGANQEDHVSMGATSARRLDSVIGNLSSIIAVELLAGARAVRMRVEERGTQPGSGTAAAQSAVESIAPHLPGDRSPSEDIERVSRAVRRGELARYVEERMGELA